MAHAPLLYLAPDGLHGYRQHRRATEHTGHFAPDASGHEAFSQWLKGSAANTAFTLLVDLPDERFRIETVPHVRGPDRKRLRERRQAQVFPDTPFVAHQYLDRDQSGRRDERVLFAALNRPSAITPWLDLIERNGHRLQRLVAVPFLAARVTRHLPAVPGPCLLALLTPAGLRIACLEGRKLLYSRLRPLPSHLPPPLSEWKDEAREAHRHLLSQRIVTHGTQCTCFLLTALPNDAEPESFPEHDNLHFIQQDPARLITGAPQSDLHDESGLPLLMHLLGRGTGLPQATPGTFLRANQSHQIVLALQAGAAVILLICIALAIANMREIQALEQRSAAAKARGDNTEQALAALLATSSAPPHPLAQLQATLDTLEQLNTAGPGPEPALHQLATALSPLPDITLRRIDWRANDNTGAPKEAPTPGQTLTLHFSLPRKSARERVAHTQRILAALRAIPTAHLSTEQIPVEMMANRPLSPAVAEADARASGLVVRLELPAANP